MTSYTICHIRDLIYHIHDLAYQLPRSLGAIVHMASCGFISSTLSTLTLLFCPSLKVQAALILYVMCRSTKQQPLQSSLPRGSKDSCLKVSEPEVYIMKGFWAILSLRVVEILSTFTAIQCHPVRLGASPLPAEQPALRGKHRRRLLGGLR